MHQGVEMCSRWRGEFAGAKETVEGINLSLGTMSGASANLTLIWRRRAMVIESRHHGGVAVVRFICRRSKWRRGASLNGSGRLFSTWP